MNTNTPRTDAARFEALRDSAFRMDCIPLKLGQELERELATSRAEVERLKKELDTWDYGTRAEREQKRAEKAGAEVAKLNHQLLKAESDLLQSQDINSFLDTEFRIACKRAEKAEAEVERLKELLKKVLFELEKVPFQNPKLTPFTAHRLADRYRDQLELATLKK